MNAGQSYDYAVLYKYLRAFDQMTSIGVYKNSMTNLEIVDVINGLLRQRDGAAEKIIILRMFPVLCICSRHRLKQVASTSTLYRGSKIELLYFDFHLSPNRELLMQEPYFDHKE